MWTLQRKTCLSFVVAKLQVNAWDSRNKKLEKSRNGNREPTDNI